MKQQSQEMERMANIQAKLKEIEADSNLNQKEKIELLEKYNEELMKSVKNYYELDEESFNFYSDRLYKISSELDDCRKLLSLEYNALKLKEDEQSLYIFEDSKIKK